MSDSLERAFVADIIAHPDDDARRLIYADWLTDNGDAARGEFIRVQIELERQPLDAPGRGALEDREANLLAAHEERWLSPVPAELLRWTWRRGFLATVEFLGADVSADLVRLCAVHPLAETKWSEFTPEPPSSLHQPGVADLPALHLAEAASSQLSQGLVGWSVPANVTGLSLRGGDPVVEVARLPCAPALTWLSLENASVADFVAALAAGAWPHLGNLRLACTGPVDVKFLRSLFAPPRAERWRDLKLFALNPVLLPVLAELPALRSLEMTLVPAPVTPILLPSSLVDLTCWPTGEEQQLFTALAESEDVERLRSLSIRLSTPIGGGVWAALGRLMGRLRGPVLRLVVRCQHAGFYADLVRLPHLDRLADLTVRTSAPAVPLEPLLECSGLTRLRELEVEVYDISEAEMRLLAQAPWLPQLRVLKLRSTTLGVGAVMMLLQSPRLCRLTSLQLDRSEMNARVLRTLQAWPGLPRLRELAITPGTLGAVEALPVRLDGLSPLAHLVTTLPLPKEYRSRFRSRHGRRWTGW